MTAGRPGTPAEVTRIFGSRFRAAFTAPAGAKVSLCASATDAAGSTITETITGTYQISS